MANDDRFHMRVPEDEKRLYEQAAKIESMTMSVWIRWVLKKAALRTVGQETHSALGVFDKKKGR
jgi:uncharacterized protein (DUF1778 family)